MLAGLAGVAVRGVRRIGWPGQVDEAGRTTAQALVEGLIVLAAIVLGVVVVFALLSLTPLYVSGSSLATIPRVAANVPALATMSGQGIRAPRRRSAPFSPSRSQPRSSTRPSVASLSVAPTSGHRSNSTDVSVAP